MRLMVPASTLNDAKELLTNGANDIYVGTTSKLFNCYSFNGRACFSKEGKRILPTFNELKKICYYVHSKGGYVYFLANIPIVNENSQIFYNEFLTYIKLGVDAGADYIILGNMTTIHWVKNKYPEIKIVVSSYLEVQNELTLKMFEEMGVSQVVLSYQCTLSEIKELTAKSKIQIEVFGHGGCSFYVGTCNMFHEMGEKTKLGYPCRAMYNIMDGDENKMQNRILDSFKMCSLCRIKALEDCGVHSLKIVGRDLPSNYILDIVKVYDQALKAFRSDKDFSKDRLPKWWIKSWCEPGTLCRYGGDFNGCNKS